MEFHNLNSLETFKEVCGHYGYRENLEDVLEAEFTRMKGNPHSHNPSSRLTHETVERVRYRILQHFNTTPEEYSVIFTSGCTAAIKLVAEAFPWRSRTKSEAGSHFCYFTDNHTSVVGIRGLTSNRGVVSLPVFPEEVENRAKDKAQGEDTLCQTPHLFCYPAQSNFSGRKYPLSHVKGIQARRLYPACNHGGQWFVLLDAASLVSCSPLNLRDCHADFIPVSFYKIFGFPTGLGALLVHNNSAGILKKAYFGGGTASAYLSGEDYYVQAANLSDRFEDGTVSFLDIIALNHSFEALYRITGGIQNIQQHTFGLARYTYILLSSLCHGNGRPVAQMYVQGQFDSPSTQGAILNFNLIDSHGDIIGYSQVDRMACLFNIHVRTGCFCNTGACQSFLGITNQQMKRNLEAGHVCGDTIDMVDGQPTGSVRVSFGYMSTFDDCQKFLSFVAECFVKKPVTINHARLERLKAASASNEETTVNIKEVTCKVEEKKVMQKGFELLCVSHEGPRTLTNIYIYPIKSCGAFEVHNWPVGPQGLLYDRSWMVVNGNGVCLSQKQEPRLCLIRPQVRLSSNELLLQASRMNTISVPLEITSATHASYPVCQSKVCGDRVETMDCGDEAASWLSDLVGQPCRLIRQSPEYTRHMKNKSDTGAASSSSLSLVNEAQYLMINRVSVELIHKVMSSRQDHPQTDTQNIISRFRANFVISGVEPFEEDVWSHVIIGNIRFIVRGQCVRCQMIGVDQNTATKTKEPLMSLSAYRNGKVTFGVYLTHQLPEGSPTACVLSAGSHILPELHASSSVYP